MALVTVQVFGHWVLTYQTWVAAAVAPGMKTWKFPKINEIPATTWSIQPPKSWPPWLSEIGDLDHQWRCLTMYQVPLHLRQDGGDR